MTAERACLCAGPRGRNESLCDACKAKPPLETVYLSVCCSAELIARVADEGTGHYECSHCGKPAEIKPKTLGIEVSDSIKAKAHLV